jgi:hypothetical protein
VADNKEAHDAVKKAVAEALTEFTAAQQKAREEADKTRTNPPESKSFLDMLFGSGS